VRGMTEPKVEVVRRLFELYASGGVEAVLEVMDEQLVIEIPPELSAEPDVYRGHDGVRRYFAGFDGMLEDVTYEPLELIPEGPRVLARIRLGGRGVSSGVDVNLEAVVLHELAGGKVIRMRPYPDMESAREALRRAAR
jgi:ketosteroid isomerase-like protein